MDLRAKKHVYVPIMNVDSAKNIFNVTMAVKEVNSKPETFDLSVAKLQLHYQFLRLFLKIEDADMYEWP